MLRLLLYNYCVCQGTNVGKVVSIAMRSSTLGIVYIVVNHHTIDLCFAV